ncbi:hypothetical protein AALA36_23080 [Lachnospiraceae bacterium 66-29]
MWSERENEETNHAVLLAVCRMAGLVLYLATDVLAEEMQTDIYVGLVGMMVCLDGNYS